LNYVLQCANTSKESEHWPFGDWPGKGPVETIRQNDREGLRELAAKVAAEQDHDRFVALVKELNQLLEGDLRESQDSAPEGNADHNKPTVGKPYEKPTATLQQSLREIEPS
jgi:hypothetical protein